MDIHVEGVPSIYISGCGIMSHPIYIFSGLLVTCTEALIYIDKRGPVLDTSCQLCNAAMVSDVMWLQHSSVA